ncbi:Ger(x)C family spore germination protein [Ornithinibacillus bavariensis]|uniref:Ger(x)C family spore germination protein n=1 Tax=Ornithinibacillus bavariensis TaxID=545502 RepID=UPI000ECF9086|nr:hypothetical protein [Ornithinibacillus sp.]
MKTMKICLILVSLLLLLSSCMESFQLENLGVILTRGTDITDDGEIEVTLSLLQFVKDSPNVNTTIKGKGKTVKGAVRNANTKTNQEIVVGKQELEIYGRSAAEKGIKPLLDTLRRDANVPNTLFLAVSESDASSLFNVQDPGISANLGEFLHGLIRLGEEKRIFPERSLPKVAALINTPGIEPTLPILGMKKGIPSKYGIALFKEDKMVGQLPLKDEVLVQVMEGTLREHYYEMTIPIDMVADYLSDKSHAKKDKNVNMVYIVEKGKGNIKLKNKEKLQFKTTINMLLNLLEISESLKLDNPEAIHGLEKEIENNIKKRFEEILSIIQELNADIFGYGVQYRIHKKGGELSTEEWNRLFPKIDVEIDVNVKIIRHGEVHR